jgi:uncharacterized protein (TIGR02996 family)
MTATETADHLIHRTPRRGTNMTATTSDRQAFLDKIAENPDDLTTRLVYADWLDERDINTKCEYCHGRGKGFVNMGPYDRDYWECEDCKGKGRFSNGFAQLACDQRLHIAAQAVIARPDDDGPRLEYAKIAEAYGRVERAEFIRVQCELARRGLENAWGDGSDLRRRQHQLWQLILPTFKPAEILMISFDQDSEADLGEGSYALVRRGFVDTVFMTMAQLLTHGPAICREYPVREVTITGLPPIQASGGDQGLLDEFRWFAGDYLEDYPETLVIDGAGIPREIFDHLEGGSPHHGSWVRTYKTREAAMLALSVACIQWTKGECR